MIDRTSSLPWNVTVLCVLTTILTWRDESSAQEQRVSSEKPSAIVAMQHEIAKLRVMIPNDSVDLTCKLHPDPILRYSDPAREFPDATLWLWTRDGSPSVVSKLERARVATGMVWQYCLAGASEESAVVHWEDETEWKATRGGLEWKPLALEQVPKAAPTGRLIQFRELARSFAGTITTHEGDKEELRLLTQPLFRYASETRRVSDGVVFGLASNGTNPECLLMLQIRRANKGDLATWEFGCIGLSAELMDIRRGTEVVFRHEGALNPGHHGHWLWSVIPIK